MTNMSHRTLVSATLCALAFSLVGHARQTANPDPDALLKREQQRVAYLTKGQFDELGRMISPTLSYTHSNGAIDGKEKYLSDLRSRQVVYQSLTHRDVAVRFVKPGVAILNGVSDVVVSVGGQDQRVPLRFTIVYVEKDGEWLFEAWHSVRRSE
jgi:hypothetical protein